MTKISNLKQKYLTLWDAIQPWNPSAHHLYVHGLVTINYFKAQDGATTCSRAMLCCLPSVAFVHHPTLMCWVGFGHPYVVEVEIVFIDAQGNKIQGSVSRDVLRMKRIEMDEGGCYDIGCVVVVPNDGKDRSTEHQYRLILDMHSKIVKVDPHPMTSYGLSPLTSSDIGRRKFCTEFLVDKIGLLTSLSPEQEYVKNDRDLTVVFAEITDPTGRIECAFYDDYLGDVRQYLKNEGACTSIVVVQFARIIEHGQVLFGDAGIETVTGITRVLFNPGIPEVFDMRNWLAMSGLSLENKVQYKDMDTPNLSLRDEFLLYHSRRQLGQLLKRGEAGMYVVWATITSIVQNDAWWYTVATHRTCTGEGSASTNCDGFYTVVPRYKLRVEATDGSDITILLLDDEDVETLLKISCKALIDSIKGPDLKTYPCIFNCLVGQNMQGCFKVKRVCAETEIIRMFVKGEFFRLDRMTRSTIARLLGKHGDAKHFNIAEGSSHATCIPLDNFLTYRSEIGQLSSSSSVSVKNRDTLEKSGCEDCQPMDKHCISNTPSGD
ncbi:Nucleic acid-binding, OB-fold [Sesbania bispinosa]|nr:Nucleic acid-binding, OB-fold [Sesbania bispinosa]